MERRKILKPGRNCWQIKRAEKIAFLIEGENYFRALYQSLPLAEEQIMILSWDIFSRLHLIPPEEKRAQALPTALADQLNHLLHEKDDLRVRILNWDFAMMFALDRELLPIYKLDLKSHRRMSFHLDDQCPLGASHHQKVVVIDDCLGFAGGLDLTRGRWDTAQHRPDDPRRQAVDGSPLPIKPYHDVQMAVSGPAAAALGQLARERWQRATGKAIAPPEREEKSLWPSELAVDLTDVDVAIARTQPAYGSEHRIDEVKQLYLDSIAAARDYIFIENQYLTSPEICRALCQRLAAADGPEVIVVLPLNVDGWLAHKTMDMIRVEMIQRLRAADRNQRFAVYYAAHPEIGEQSINLHAKIMVSDDCFLRIGSANLNNRSMGLDTECDLALEAPADSPRVSEAIKGFRNRLLSQHLACEVDEIDAQISRQGSVIAGIEALRHAGRSLQPLGPRLPDLDAAYLAEIKLADPEQPINTNTFINHFVPDQHSKTAGLRIAAWVLALLLILAAAAAWRFTPLNQWLDTDYLVALAGSWQESPLAPLLTLISFVVAGLLMVPITAIIIVAQLIFDPLPGFAYALTGSLLCALAGYGLGHLLGGRTVRRLAGGKINQISRKLGKRGILTILFVRIVPVAPFTLINLVAGASHIKLRDFLLGSVLGMAPGIFGVVLLTDRVKAMLESPDWTTLATLLLVAALVFACGYVLSRHLLRLDPEKSAAEDRQKP
jgi:phosphatidylserine/phosphatidylglycerophosphate/cardiolipin synthase-like enzyme/membrane protein YqaA with SNARE-associated domain